MFLDTLVLFLSTFAVCLLLLTPFSLCFLDIDNSFYTVKFDSLLLKEAVLEADAIIPPLRESDDSSSDEDDEDGVEDSGYAQG